MSTNKRGKTKHVPVIVLNEIETIKKQEGFVNDSFAFSELARRARVGWEFEQKVKKKVFEPKKKKKNTRNDMGLGWF